MNRKEELLSKIRELSKKIGSVKVYFNEYKTGGNDGMVIILMKKINYGNLMYVVNLILFAKNQRTKLMS